jgi:hypothetical protein
LIVRPESPAKFHVAETARFAVNSALLRGRRRGVKFLSYVLVAALTLLIAVLVGFAAWKTYRSQHDVCGGGAASCALPAPAAVKPASN